MNERAKKLCPASIWCISLHESVMWILTHKHCQEPSSDTLRCRLHYPCADKTSARDLSYVQLHEFEASVSLMWDGAWHPMDLGWFAILNAILQEQIQGKCGMGCKKWGSGGRGWLGSVSLHRGRLLCMKEEEQLYRLS